MASDSYKQAGVDIEAGDRLVRTIAPAARSTARPGADAALGGFGGLFDPRAAGYRDPILVAATDGVGTKLKLAFATNAHATVGIDLVAMCVNDLLVQGAEPLFFLDYFATGRLDADAAAAVVKGVAEGCRIAGCVLIGGETAEMPGMYSVGEYDLAGFAVGAFERGSGLPRDDIAPGDALLGVASSGLHSNGFSLVRKIIGDAGVSLDAPAPFEPERALGEALLTPTRIYISSVLPGMRDGRIKAAAHITGGGVVDNVPRMLPDHLRAEIDYGAWPRKAVFDWLQNTGDIDEADMRRTFNCGVGLVLVAPETEAESLSRDLSAAGETVWRIGEIAPA